MAEEEDGVTSHEECENKETGTPVIMKMFLFSTWEVRNVPSNCVSRLCTLTVTRVEILRPIESGVTSVVLATSMKTPHRSLRSNEIEISPSGTLNIPIEITFSLQYPHFLKRGGNVLQVKLQRRKRYRQRPIGGYKTLAVGEITMAHVLQHSFQGAVRLYAEKIEEHVALVTVGSLTTTATLNDSRLSSDEEEDELFSDDLRGSDSDNSAENDHSSFSRHHTEQKAKENKGISNAVFSRLLKFRQGTKRPAELPEAVLESDRVSAVTFVSSISDSEEEEEVIDDTVSSSGRPRLSPFFGSDRMSIVSFPSTRVADIPEGSLTKHVYSSSGQIRRYGSFEEAVGLGTSEAGPVTSSFTDCELQKGRIWIIAANSTPTEAIQDFIASLQESVLEVNGKDDIQFIQSFLHYLENHSSPLQVVLIGEDCLISSVLQALISMDHLDILRFAYLPICLSGTISSRLVAQDTRYQALCSKWVESYNSDSGVFEYLEEATHILQMPIAKITLHKSSTEQGSSSTDVTTLPLICSVSVRTLDTEPELQASPTSPTATSNTESQELSVEYSVVKTSKQTDKVNIKVRSILVSLTGQGLTITALNKDKKGKGIKIRKKDSDAGPSVLSITTGQLVCKKVSKHDPPITVIVDGIEWHGISMIKMFATWESTAGRFFPLATWPPST